MNMKKYIYPLLVALLSFGFAACDHTPDEPEAEEALKCIYILNEGSMGADNASLSRLDLENDAVLEDFYATVNNSKLGDTANDILVTDKNIIIAVNGSNIIQFCDLNGKSVAQTEAVPACRRMAVDKEQKYLYVTSYANDGEVVKIDLSTFKDVAKVKVGYEPDGIVCYGGKLYVANTGGNAWLGTHGYEETISVINASTMTEEKRIKTGHMNLYGGFIQNDKFPRYIMVNASGDYYMNPAASFIFDCETESIVKEFDDPATYVASYDGKFYCIGSSFSYETYAYEYSFKTIDMSTGSPVVSDGLFSTAITDAVKNEMIAPYGLYIDREGTFYVSDAADYKNRGSLYKFSKEDGRLQTKVIVGVCPGHFASK